MVENPPAFPWLHKILRYHETGGHEGDGSDHALRMARAELDRFPLSEKRDWFAGQALAQVALDVFADPALAKMPPSHLPAIIAAASYQIADALLAERAKEQQP